METSLGGPAGHFPSTLWSVIEESQALTDEQARDRLGRIISAYWKPVYVCIRAGWRKSPEDAKDLTQSFFSYLLTAGVLAKVRRGRGRFRAFLRATLKHWLSNQRRGEQQIKRGGDESFVRLDLSDPELEGALPGDPGGTPEEIFDNEWARSLLAGAVERFREIEMAKGNTIGLEILRLFEESDGEEGAKYDAIAAKLGITRDAVYHQLSKGRAAIREIIVQRIKEYALDDVEVQQELDLLRNAWS